MGKLNLARTGKKRGRHQAPSKSSNVHPVLAAHRELLEAQKVRKSGDIKRAIKIGEKLIANYPDYVGALHELGIAQMAARDYNSALGNFVRATMLNPDDWTTLASLAQCYVQLDALEMAARTLEQAQIVNNEDAEIYFTLGAIYERQREYEAAVTALRQALDRNPEHAMAANLLGSSLVHLGKLEEAAEAFHQSHIADPKSISPIAASAHLPAGVSLFDVEAAMKSAEVDPTVSNAENEAREAFAAASLLHKNSKHDEAWQQLMLANGLIRKNLDQGVQRRKLFHEQLTSLNETAICDRRWQNYRPRFTRFIVHSGCISIRKNYAERLIGEASGVKRGYENPIVELAVKRSSQKAGLLTIGSVLELPKELGKSFTSHYVTEIKRRRR